MKLVNVERFIAVIIFVFAVSRVLVRSIIAFVTKVVFVLVVAVGAVIVLEAIVIFVVIIIFLTVMILIVIVIIITILTIVKVIIFYDCCGSSSLHHSYSYYGMLLYRSLYIDSLMQTLLRGLSCKIALCNYIVHILLSELYCADGLIQMYYMNSII